MSESTELEIALHSVLRRIAREYMTPDQLRRDAKNVGLDYEEYLEMTYENIQGLAAAAIRGVRIRKPKPAALNPGATAEGGGE